MLRNSHIGQHKSTANVIKQPEGTGVPRVSNMEEVSHNKPLLYRLAMDILYNNLLTLFKKWLY